MSLGVVGRVSLALNFECDVRWRMSLLRASFGICGLLALINALLAQSVLVEYLAYLVAFAAFGLTAWWRRPL